jgi:ectoine hydroxylase-related dioxygenase (phytanoyl-CoA dioxygenase family)
LATEQRTTTAVSAQEGERFGRDGYFVFDPEIPEDVIDGARSDMEAKYRYHGETVIDELGVLYLASDRPRVQDGWKVNQNVKQIALAPKVLAVCEELYGRKPLPFQTLNFPVGTQQSPHADAMHFNSDPPGYMCGVWVALEDIDMDNGPLIYFPGSHKLPLPTWDELGRPEEGTGEGYPRYENINGFMAARGQKYEGHVQKMIESHDLRPEYGTIGKGQALLWAAQLLHGGSPQRDNTRTRHSQVTHYYFEGCRQYTPMRTEGAREFWRYPWWVRPEGVKDVVSALREAVGERVPSDATVLLVGKPEEEEALRDQGGRAVRHFEVADDAAEPSASVEESSAVKQLEDMRQAGAQYLVVTKDELGRLTNACNNLQQHLEGHYQAVFRDGACCAIYDLTSR